MVRFDEDGGEGADEHLAPVTPLFGGDPPSAAPAGAPQARAEEPEWDRTWAADDARSADEHEPDAASKVERRDAAEKQLLRKLRGKPLSLAEARTLLAAHELDDDDASEIIDAACRLGYLDDVALAEHLVHIAVDRKDQGRTAVAQTLTKRRISRDIVDAALDALPDDDRERALSFARSKARQLDRVEPEAALRRLVGQLSRRGYASSVAMNAARQALDEQRRGGGVRFR